MRELALHVLDALQNSIAAGATTVTLAITEELSADRLVIEIGDDGCGMPPETLRQAVQPFFTSRTTRRVGLGLPLFAAAAERAGGTLELQSEEGRGTELKAVFELSHPDRQPLGDVISTLLTFCAAERSPRLLYRHVVRGGGDGAEEHCFDCDTAELQRELGTTPLNHPVVQCWLSTYLKEGETALGGLA